MFREIVGCVHCNSENVSLRSVNEIQSHSTAIAHYYCNASKCHKNFTYIYSLKRGIK